MPDMPKMTKAQAGALGGRAGLGGRKRRTKPVTAPKPARVKRAHKPDPMAALPGESETERRMRLDLPVLQVSNPVAPVALPPGFTVRPHYQS